MNCVTMSIMADPGMIAADTNIEVSRDKFDLALLRYRSWNHALNITLYPALPESRAHRRPGQILS